MKNNLTTQGLGKQNLLSFLKQDSLKYWRPKTAMSTVIYVNQSESLSRSFSDLLGDKWRLQRKYMCRQHETLDCRKFHKPLSNSCHRSDMQTCKLSRISCVTHEFRHYLTDSRKYFQISRIHDFEILTTTRL
jgi:hypothetical protein